MKKISYVAMLALLCSIYAFADAEAKAAAPNVEWSRAFGGSGTDEANFIQQTNDDGYIFAGWTSSSDGDVSGNPGGERSAWIVKLNAAGRIEWQRAFGGSGRDIALFVRQTNDGGYIFTGWTTSSDGDVSGNPGGQSSAWIVKLNASGDIEWLRCLGGSGADSAVDIQQTSDGGYIFAGSTSSDDGDVSGNPGGERSAWIVKLNASGNIEWQRCFGGSGADTASSIQQTSDGGYIFAGTTTSNDGDVSGNPGGERSAWIVKLNTSGDIEWQRVFGGSGNDWARSIRQTSDSGYIFAGWTNSSDGDVPGNPGGQSSAWVVKLNASGNIEWQRVLGGSGSDFVRSIRQTSDGGYIFAGNTSSDDGDVPNDPGGGFSAWIVKLSASGNIEWQRVFGGSGNDVVTSIEQTSDGGYIFAGETTSHDGDVSGNPGDWRPSAWIVKLAPYDGGSE